MYITKLKSKMIAISDDNIYKGNSVRVQKVTPQQLVDFLDRHPVGVEWIADLEGNLMTGDPISIDLFNTIFKIEGVEKPDAKYKLVRFPGNEIIRLCARGKCKKSYKNTIIVEDDIVKQFISEATSKQPYIEIRANKSKEKYKCWSDYIDLMEPVSKIYI